MDEDEDGESMSLFKWCVQLNFTLVKNGFSVDKMSLREALDTIELMKEQPEKEPENEED